MTELMRIKIIECSLLMQGNGCNRRSQSARIRAPKVGNIPHEEGKGLGKVLRQTHPRSPCEERHQQCHASSQIVVRDMGEIT